MVLRGINNKLTNALFHKFSLNISSYQNILSLLSVVIDPNMKKSLHFMFQNSYEKDVHPYHFIGARGIGSGGGRVARLANAGETFPLGGCR